jgi:hypothetical protein
VKNKGNGTACSGGADSNAILCEGEYQQDIGSPLVAKKFVRKIRPHGLGLWSYSHIQTVYLTLHPKNKAAFWAFLFQYCNKGGMALKT